MENSIFREIPTKLDLNGPIVSYTEQPTGTTGIGTGIGGTEGASLSFTGIATAIVGSSGTGGTGYVAYQWYEEGVGVVENDDYISGAASTGPVGTAATLTLSNLITPTDNQRKFYVQADYVPSYVVGVQSVTRPGYKTGNAINEPLNSGIATATVTPLIEVVSQPSEGVQALLNADASISVNADLTDSYFADDVTYQWYLNGEAVVDGVKEVTTTTGSTVQGTVEETYTEDEIHSTPALAEDIQVTIAGGSGGNGGVDGDGPGGSGGNGRAGRFSIPAGAHTLNFYVGKRGNGGASGNATAGGQGGVVTGDGDGGNGGGAGPSGWSGGGGGGGAASYMMSSGERVVVAGGGGGGGGGSWQVGGEDAIAVPAFVSTTDVTLQDGDAGSNSPSDGGGGGGSGGGSHNDYARARYGIDRSRSSGGGGGGGSKYHSTNATLLSEWTVSGDGYANLKYTGYTDTTITTTTKTTLSGTTSNTLTISSDSVGVQTCQCKITSATASNSPIWTDVANFVSTSTLVQNNINIEAIGIGITATLTSINLSNGDYTFNTTQSQVDSGGITKYYSLYAPDKDIDVEMDLYGGKGINASTQSDPGTGNGGEGGYSRIRFTMKHNEEYVIVGLRSDINSPFVYRQGELMAVVGGGGDGGKSRDGGNGGGVSNEGQNGSGRTGGTGGLAIEAGTIGANGVFGGKYLSPVLYPGDLQIVNDVNNVNMGGGRTIRCTKGVYWAQQGVSACSDMSGLHVFRLPDGTPVENTALITRGYKAGYNIMETAGEALEHAVGVTYYGNGGNGATGGDGAGDAADGGGGASGYNDGSITIVDTQQGGSTDDAKVILRVVT